MHKQVEVCVSPSFFVIGPPRTGTSWLHDVLRHQACLPTPSKETRFFDLHFERGLAWYAAHFPKACDGRPAGEVAPTYFASREARDRIAALLPASRVVCIFRDPVERIISLYRVKRAYGLVPWDFEEALLADPELLASSKYAANLLEWQQAFGPDRVLATLYDDLRDDPQSYVDALADFLALPRFHLSPSQHRSVHGSDSLTHPRSYFCTRQAMRVAERLKARRLDRIVAIIRESRFRKLFLGGGPPFAEVAHEVRSRLYEVFRPEVEQLEQLLLRDLSAWKRVPMAISPSRQYQRTGIAAMSGTSVKAP
jgi:hypothetical protein